MSAKSSSNFLLECFAECSIISYKDTKFPTRLQVFSKILFYLHPSEHHLHIGKRTVKQNVTTLVQMFTFFKKKVVVTKRRTTQLNTLIMLSSQIDIQSCFKFIVICLCSRFTSKVQKNPKISNF